MNDNIADDATTTRTLNSTGVDSAFSSIDHAGDEDWFSVAFNKAYNYQVWLEGSTLLDPYLTIYGPGGPVSNDDGFDNGYDSFLYYDPATTGTYYLAAESFDAGTGSYSLTVERDTPGDVSSTIYVVVDGAPFTERVGYGIDVADWVVVDLTAGTTYQFDLMGDGGVASLDDPWLALRNRNGTLVMEQDDDSGSGTNSRIVFTPAVNGTYVLDVQAFFLEDSGSYQLFATRLGGTVRNGTGGNDAFNDASGSETFEGGAGIDTVVYAGRSSDYGVIRTGNGFTVTPRNETLTTDKANNIENLLFDDRGPYGPGGSAVVNAATGLIDGGAGIDTLYLRGTHTQYTINYTPSGVTVTGNGLNEKVINVERLAFSDGLVGLDSHGNAGMAYRIYQAAFDRTPDVGGLGYWINRMDNGTTVTEVAANFVGSAEFQSTYGNLNNSQYAAQLYRNVLHREADAGGLSFWTTALISGSMSRPQVLASFSESNENQVNLIGVIEDGVYYQLPA